MSTSTVDEVVEQLNALPQDLQRRVLEFSRALAQFTPRDVPGRDLLRFSGVIPPDEVSLMSDASERACEHVDIGEW